MSHSFPKMSLLLLITFGTILPINTQHLAKQGTSTEPNIVKDVQHRHAARLDLRTKVYYYRGRKFKVVIFPYGEGGLVPTFHRYGKLTSLRRIKQSTGALAVTTASYYDRHTSQLIDYCYQNGQLIKGREVGFPFLWKNTSGHWGLSANFTHFSDKKEIDTMVSLCESLSPLPRRIRHSPQSTSKVARIAIGLTHRKVKYADGCIEARQMVCIVRSPRAKLTELSAFMTNVLGCSPAINLDGGSSLNKTLYALTWSPAPRPTFIAKRNPG